MAGKEVDLKQGDTSGYNTSIVVNIRDSGKLSLEGESCRIVQVAKDGKEVYIDVLNSTKTTTSVQAGYKGYLIRGTVTLE